MFAFGVGWVGSCQDKHAKGRVKNIYEVINSSSGFATIVYFFPKVTTLEAQRKRESSKHKQGLNSLCPSL